MRYVFIPFLLWLILSCSSTKEVPTDRKCTRYYRHDFSEIINEKYTTINNEDTVSFHHLRFQCTSSAMSSHIAVYNKFGKWHKEIYAKDSKRPFLMWENVALFSNGKQYTVYTFGEEKYQDTHATVMVFDQHGKDLLSESSEEKEALTNYFATIIRDRKNKEDAFVREYGKQLTLNVGKNYLEKNSVLTTFFFTYCYKIDVNFALTLPNYRKTQFLFSITRNHYFSKSNTFI